MRRCQRQRNHHGWINVDRARITNFSTVVWVNTVGCSAFPSHVEKVTKYVVFKHVTTLVSCLSLAINLNIAVMSATLTRWHSFEFFCGRDAVGQFHTGISGRHQH